MINLLLMMSVMIFFIFIELSRENRKGRKNVVDTLLGNSEKSSNYGRRGTS